MKFAGITISLWYRTSTDEWVGEMEWEMPNEEMTETLSGGSMRVTGKTKEEARNGILTIIGSTLLNETWELEEKNE